MNQLLPATAKRKARRLVLLASVAGLAIAAVAMGPSSFNGSNLPAFTTPALADSVQPSAGFADIVAKVKPAVISVRVKIDESAKTTGMGDNDESESGPRIPFEKFFEQFGRPDMPVVFALSSILTRTEITAGFTFATISANPADG